MARTGGEVGQCWSDTPGSDLALLAAIGPLWFIAWLKGNKIYQATSNIWAEVFTVYYWRVEGRGEGKKNWEQEMRAGGGEMGTFL